MASIAFKQIPIRHVKSIVSAFELIASGKRSGSINEAPLRSMLGDLYDTKFISTKAESDYWLEKWRTNPTVEAPWDFGSWVDAFINAEIDLQKLSILPDGSGEIVFEQLSYPSGGLEALEELIKVFGGAVVSNSAL
jgi:hypothetical protein